MGVVAAALVPGPLPAAITRSRQHVQAVLAQSLLEMGQDGRAALAWQWALTGTRPSPVTLSLATGYPPSREDILAEAASPSPPTPTCRLSTAGPSRQPSAGSAAKPPRRLWITTAAVHTSRSPPRLHAQLRFRVLRASSMIRNCVITRWPAWKTGESWCLPWPRSSSAASAASRCG